MSTRHDRTTLRRFHTPVRGHTFASRPAGGAPLERSPLRLRREPDNPADPYAVAVWADGGGRPWRVGYLERAVAARLLPLLEEGRAPSVEFTGWVEEPHDRWRRPLVAIGGTAEDRTTGRRPAGLAALPPFRTVRRLDAA